jgi:hypothetical protein
MKGTYVVGVYSDKKCSFGITYSLKQKDNSSYYALMSGIPTSGYLR